MGLNQSNPFNIFTEWFVEAQKYEPTFPDAMTLSTLRHDGWPNSRIVLLKEYSEAQGFVFYTNYKSQKSMELMGNPKASLCFLWKSTQKQVRVIGTVHQASKEQSDRYFSSRPRLSQIGAWASKQSQPLQNHFDLEKRVAEFSLKFGVGEISRPEFWGGWVLVPHEIEFWHEKPFRLHDRKVFKLTGDVNAEERFWVSQELFP